MYSLWFMRLDPSFMKSLPFASMRRKGSGISGSFIGAHIFFHFSRRFYLGFKMWIIITPPKHIFTLRLDFGGKHWILLLEATILNRCFLWWNKSFCICMFFVKLFKPLIFLPRRYLNYCNWFLCFASSFKRNLFQHLFYFLWNNWLQNISF